MSTNDKRKGEIMIKLLPLKIHHKLALISRFWTKTHVSFYQVM